MSDKQQEKDTKPSKLTITTMKQLGGRPKKIDKDKIKIAEDLYTRTKMPIVNICQKLGVSRPTFYAYLAGRYKND